MNISNIISLIRIPLLFICVLLLHIKRHYSATFSIFIYLISVWSDWLDGYLARKYHIQTPIGAFIDALTDKIFMMGMMITLLSLHALPEWSLFLVLTIFLRELLITGLRAIAATHDIVIPAQKEGKQKTVFQMSSVFLILLWYTLRVDYSQYISEEKIRFVYYLGLVLFSYATYLTVTSGIIYIKRFSAVLKDI